MLLHCFILFVSGQAFANVGSDTGSVRTSRWADRYTLFGYWVHCELGVAGTNLWSRTRTMNAVVAGRNAPMGDLQLVKHGHYWWCQNHSLFVSVHLVSTKAFAFIRRCTKSVNTISRTYWAAGFCRLVPVVTLIAITLFGSLTNSICAGPADWNASEND